jgi:transcriptional regulator with XRE-family HTH domain
MTKLRALRFAKGLTLKEVAQDIGLHLSDISKIETGRLTAYPSQGAKLSLYYGYAHINELLEEATDGEILLMRKQADKAKDRRRSLSERVRPLLSNVPEKTINSNSGPLRVSQTKEKKLDITDRPVEWVLMYEARKRSTLVASALCFFAGNLGFHRFYVGDEELVGPRSYNIGFGLLMITTVSIVLIMGGFYIGFIPLVVPWGVAAIDYFRVSGMVDLFNRALQNHLDERFKIN